eukprot:gene5254-10510_t
MLIAKPIKFDKIPGGLEAHLLRKIKTILPTLSDIQSEYCFNVEVTTEAPLTPIEKEKLMWLFAETFEPENTGESTFLSSESNANSLIIEVGPRLAFTTAWSSNCVSICQACGIGSVGRIERSRRYLITSADRSFNDEEISQFSSLIHDRMTECVYSTPLLSFESGIPPQPVTIVPVLSEGRSALERINKEKGLGFDDWDLDFYTNLFKEKLQRDPTDVECFDMGQSNSEHSRHWFFGGRMIIDGETKEQSLFSLVKGTLSEPSNSIIAFHDNSSAIEGYEVNCLTPATPGTPSPMTPCHIKLHPILTAETHNFPSGVAPFPGAETGTGGRLRDVQATGRGAHSLAGISAYCVGNLHIPHHPLPWEKGGSGSCKESYASNLASPLDIEVDASNGASDYGMT